MSPIGAIFEPFPLKTGTKLLHRLPPSIVERVFVRQGDIIVSHVPSDYYQHADVLTKVLAFDLFAIHRRFLTILSD